MSYGVYNISFVSDTENSDFLSTNRHFQKGRRVSPRKAPGYCSSHFLLVHLQFPLTLKTVEYGTFRGGTQFTVSKLLFISTIILFSLVCRFELYRFSTPFIYPSPTSNLPKKQVYFRSSVICLAWNSMISLSKIVIFKNSYYFLFFPFFESQIYVFRNSEVHSRFSEFHRFKTNINPFLSSLYISFIEIGI